MTPQKADRELLVRFKKSQATRSEAVDTARRALGRLQTANVDLVNSQEGVVKLEFATEAELAAARETLANSPQVENVSSNFLYKPQLRMRRALETEDPTNFYPYLGPSNTSPIVIAPMRVLPDAELPAGPVKPGADPLEAKDWATAKINLPAAASLPAVANPRQPTITAVIDTGVDYNHEDLIHGMWRSAANPKEVGYDFAHNVDKPYDVYHFDIEGCLKDLPCALGFGNQEKFLVNPGHGTHCAGRVAAVANNSLGIRGVGTGTQLMALKFFYDVGEPNAGTGDDAAAVRAIDYAIKNGAKIISASWGGDVPRAEAEKGELKEAILRAQKAGVLFIVAAGNGRVNENTGDFEQVDQDNDPAPSYPAAYTLDNIITVAASDPADNLADFSNYGANTVHIAAPGTKILSTVAQGNKNRYDDAVARIKKRDGSVEEIPWDGTSMATPIVAGTAALIWSRYPKLSYLEVKEALLSSVRKSSGLSGKVASGGVLDVEAALEAAERLSP